MLLGNNNLWSRNPLCHRSGIGFISHSVAWGYPGQRRNFSAGEATVVAGVGIARKAAVPSGYSHPAAWVLADQAGGLASRNEIEGAGDFSASIAGGLNGEAALSGSGDIVAANLALVVSAVAALSGSGSLSADIVGKLEAAADLAGSGDLVAGLGALADLVAELTGSGAASGEATGKAFASADIVVTGELLNTANVAAAVWDVVAGAYNSPGSMGEKLNDAGSASNPWTEVIESGYTAAEILRLLAAAAAGKVSIDIDGTVHIRDLADSKDRIVAETTDEGERTDVTRDVS